MGLIDDHYNADRTVRQLLYKYKAHIAFAKHIDTLINPMPLGYKHELLCMSVVFDSGARLDWRTYTRDNILQQLMHFAQSESLQLEGAMDDVLLSQKFIKEGTNRPRCSDPHRVKGVKDFK